VATFIDLLLSTYSFNILEKQISAVPSTDRRNRYQHIVAATLNLKKYVLAIKRRPKRMRRSGQHSAQTELHVTSLSD
jgi:hypothetical protein